MCAGHGSDAMRRATEPTGRMLFALHRLAISSASPQKFDARSDVRLNITAMIQRELTGIGQRSQAPRHVA
jgi:hypothetical protein